jgi:hypothetical protein
MTSKTGFIGLSFGIFAVFLAIIALPPAFGQTLNPDPPAQTVKLIFIHHSTGEGWLSDDQGGLAIALMNSNYFVSDTNYSWGPDEIGSSTDIGHWYNWFLGPDHDTYCTELYAESGEHSSYTRMETDPGGNNEIIMFKSCFPNSTIFGNPGDAPLPKGQTNPIYGQGCCGEDYTVANVKGLYRDLLDYFAARQDKLFILIVSPPLTQASTTSEQAANARAVANWLMTDWLADYSFLNVRAFDYYNVLTSNGGNLNTNDAGQENGNHHRYWNSAIQHIQTVANNYCSYGSSSDDSHPTPAGHQKATAEYVPLLNIWYNAWKDVPASTLTVTEPSAGTVWYTGSTVTITWAKSGGQDANVKIQLYKGATKVLDISRTTPNDESFDWVVRPSLAGGANYSIRITTLDNHLRDDSDTLTVAKPKLTVTAPVKAVTWNKGTTQTIIWTANGPQNANVKIELLRSGAKVLNISLSAPNSGTYDWTVLTSLPTSSAYKVRVRTLDNLVTGLSPVFTIS